MNASPKTTRTKPGDPLEQELVAEDPAADERGADAEQDEERREADDERDAGRDDAPRGPRLAEPVRVDRRDRREVRGDERKDAGREERDHPGEECDRDRGPAHRTSGVEPRELLVDEALELGVEMARLARQASASRRRLHVRTRNADRDRADERARRAEGARRAGRSRRSGGSASTPGPNSATSASLISCSESPAAIRARMNAFIRSAIGAFDWSSVVSQTGQTISDSRSAAFGGAAPSPPPAATSAPRAATTRERGSRRARPRSRLRSRCALLRPRSRRPANARDDRPSRSMHERLGEPGHAVAADRVARARRRRAGR